VLDDFGTGYSSLASLRDSPVAALKIDRSFVSGLPADAPLVAAIVSLAGALGLEVVAEGVEQQAQADALRELGCGFAQGFLFGPPE
jgi:EAL domain-containing protein (putative c-di-GMP-specific phosphodiesterase class I)